MELKKLLSFPLNIQLFAEGGENDKGGSGTPPEPKTYSEEEYKKMKESFDKASSELAKLKKEATARLSEDEKRAKELEERENHYKELEKKVLRGDMTKELMSSGLDNDSIEKIVEVATNDSKDLVELSKQISSLVSTAIAKAKEDAKKEFQGSGMTPPVGTGTDNKNTFIEEMNERRKGKNSARDYYLNKNKK